MKHLRFPAIAFAVLLVLFSAAACGGSASGKQAGFPVEVGGVSFSAAPKRVVSLSPSLTDTLGMLGFGARLVAVGEGCDSPAAAGLPACGTVFEPDLDQILSLSPDLVLSASRLSDESLRVLQQSGIQTLVLSRADSLDGIYDNWGALCRLFTGEARGAQLEEQLRYYGGVTLDYLSSAVSAAGAEGAGAVYLRRLPSTVATGDSYEGQLLAGLGLRNPAGEDTGWAFHYEQEQAPDVDLIFCDASVSPVAFAESDLWKETAAVQNSRVFPLDGAAFERQSPALFAVFEEAMRAALPDGFVSPKPSVLLPLPEEPQEEPGWWEKLTAGFGK